MKHNVMLTVACPLSTLFMTFQRLVDKRFCSSFEEYRNAEAQSGNVNEHPGPLL